MSKASVIGGTNPNSSSFWDKVIKSKWTDAALITGFVALLIIGIAASTGAFNAIGTTNAAYLSYGMYAGAALLLAAQIAKLVRNCLKEKISKPDLFSQVSTDSVEMRKRAKSLAQTSNNPKAAIAYILTVSKEDSFLQSPHLYVDDWIVRKGGIPQSSTDPEDCALLFWIGERNLGTFDKWVGK